MAGHSKWKQIKRAKGVTDAKRGQLFTKLTREIIVAAKTGGGDPAGNFRLRLAVQKARDSDMPLDNIDRAIKKATGEGAGQVTYHEMTYEGYAPGGAAIMGQALTDNKNRTSAEIRAVFARFSGSLAGAGSVSWLFQKKGQIALPLKGATEERLMELALEAGAEDLSVDAGQAVITTSPQALEPVKQALQSRSIAWESAELTAVPSSTVRVSDASQAKTLLSLMDALEEQEDTQHVYANFDIPDEILAEHIA